MSTDVKYNAQYWLNGMSNIATNNGENRKFKQNWNEYYNENYKTGANSDSALQQELNAMMNLTKGDSSAALVYFSIVLGQTELNKGADVMNEISDQMNDLANVANLISNLKNLFNEANSLPAGSSKDNVLTKAFINRLNILNNHLKNDGWLSSSQGQGAESLYSEVSAAIANIANLVGTKNTSGLSLATIWQQATCGFMYQPFNGASFPSPSTAVWTCNCNLGDNAQGFIGDLQEIAAQLQLNNPQQNITYSNGVLTMNLSALGTDVPAWVIFFQQGSNLYLPDVWNVYMSRLGWPAQNSENLQTMLQSFDTINSSTTSLSASYQGEEQYSSSNLQQMGGTLSYTQNTIIQMLSALNSNTKNQ